jgi:hypothetical protein
LLSKEKLHLENIKYLFAAILLVVAGWILGHIWDLQDFGEILTGVGMFTVYVFISIILSPLIIML